MISREFIELINMSIPRIKAYPFRTDHFIYNKRFTPEWLVDHLNNQKYYDKDDDMIWMDGGHCYQHIFDEMDFRADNKTYMTYICDSNDIGETFHADYSYYYGIIGGNLNAKGIPFIYARPCHELESPSRLTYYTNNVQISMIACSIYINIYETIPDVKNMFTIHDEEIRANTILEFLKNTDRTLKEFDMED